MDDERNKKGKKERLAWHETMELHEVVAATSHHLMLLKRTVNQVSDPELRQLYMEAINNYRRNLQQLLNFYNVGPYAPRESEEERKGDRGFFAGTLLGMAKNDVRMYAAAITETATPSLRNVFIQQLNGAIHFHYKVFLYMYRHGLYPAYDLAALRQGDVNLAQRALNM
ncbi:MAG TPA: spore coat protein [Bacillales bacterium]|nr:spore coat protein [Bacillales bacterium]